MDGYTAKPGNTINLTDEPLPVEEIIATVADVLEGGAGAVVPFIGIVRNLSLGHRIQFLEYHAYAPMALREMQRVADEVRERWDLPCAIWHRLGKLGIGEASVVVVVSSPHRAAAFEACRYAIDRVKEQVPIWKKEVAEDGYWWVEDPLTMPPAKPLAEAGRDELRPPGQGADEKNGGNAPGPA